MAIALASCSSSTSDDVCSCVLTSLAHSLPAYTPSPPAPNYSHQPACGERSLQHSLGAGFRFRNPDHMFVKTTGKYAITLRGQEPGIRTPWYGRDEIINGFVSIEDPERVTSVELLVDGKLDITMAEGFSKVTTLVNASSTLWKRSESSQTYPGNVEFAFSLPDKYESGGKHYPLPPSFHEIERDGPQFLIIRSAYRIRVSITKAPKNVFTWEKTEHVFLTFDYLPRSRGMEPISTVPGCLANIKSLPNEWYQATRTFPIDSHPHLEPVTANLFIPSARVYPMTDAIPFHVQVSGPVSSLKVALLSGEADSSPSSPRISPTSSITGSSGKRRSLSIPIPRSKSPTAACLRKCEPKTLRVYIIRQIRAEIRVKKQLKNIIIAEGTLESVPPVMTDCYSRPHDGSMEYLSWSGSLKCVPEVRTGGFEGENVKVTDYVALTIGNSKVPWVDMKCSIGIKLVTDSWEDPPEIQL
ncbi:hypothetical protein FA13DRAFT_1618864 [Coprinellus micaceus]|uniref:Arrestin-like N-terminal domain-containing protein n=1 Tax=Coprinellus micaceus TaxID=71717 RepID=A0A4Y7TZN3_COPMI|nr:hypothetical protein FA13DRAFT_1618864 [Coprinellus micaceus]